MSADTYPSVSYTHLDVYKRQPHGYTVGPQGGRVLVVTPAGLDRYFAEVAERLALGPVPLDIEAEIAAHYGQEFLDRLLHWGQ